MAKDAAVGRVSSLATLPTQMWSEQALCVVHAFDINVPENLRIGYVTAENEPVPEALERLGIHVEMLDAAALAFGDLSRFNAIVVGVRAYELRADLAGANQRLLDYVSGGGKLVVQYQRDFAWDKVSEGIPYFLQDQRPGGFLGRSVPARYPELRLPQRVIDWTDDHYLRYLTQHGAECVGDLILGAESLDEYLRVRQTRAPIPEALRSQRYPELASIVMAGGLAGSSAHGEHPKFTAVEISKIIY